MFNLRKRATCVETTYHEDGPDAPEPLQLTASLAVIQNPYAGRYEEDQTSFMSGLRSRAATTSSEFVDVLAKSAVDMCKTRQ